MTLAAIVLSLPLMLVGLRVLGETNWGPISALSNMMQGVFAAIAPGNVGANMVASGTTGTIATSSEAIMQDYKCGDVVGTKPRLLTIMQLIAVPVGAAAVSLVYPVLVETYHLSMAADGAGDRSATGSLVKAGLTSPISQKWAGFAQILEKGPGALPTSALYLLVDLLDPRRGLHGARVEQAAQEVGALADRHRHRHPGAVPRRSSRCSSAA